MAGTKRPRKAYLPRPVHTWLPSEVRMHIDILGFFFTDKLARGTFDDIDSNTVAYLLNMCHYLAVQSRNEAMLSGLDASFEAYKGVRRRHERTGKYGASGAELVTLREHMPHIANYFTTRPQHRIAEAREYVLRVNERMKAEGALYCEPDGRGEFTNVEIAA
jgi:hypothetical protein